MLTHEQRVDRLDGLIEFFEGLSDEDLRRPVPACPGWDIGNVVAHIGYAAMLVWIVPTTHAGWSTLDMGGLQRSMGDGRGAEVFPGVMRTLSLLLRSHSPDDPAVVVCGDQTWGGLARLATAEVAVHRLDCLEALGPAPKTDTAMDTAMDSDHALDALDWTTSTWLPKLAPRAAPMPEGRLVLRAATRGEDTSTEFEVGSGDEVASVEGAPLELLRYLWGRRVEVEPEGDLELAGSWRDLTPKTTRVDARH
ncbi:MAG: maleylpyruvate isomerase family mycothiol-dependent enzyme [Actinomycetota bacterium]|nr:maleylpyruvate isomerase family mycothiol-dependent enzyme [Actinomycetota bacterium]